MERYYQEDIERASRETMLKLQNEMLIEEILKKIEQHLLLLLNKEALNLKRIQKDQKEERVLF